MSNGKAIGPIKIALTTVGSTGDIQPFLALGVELMTRGHDVVAVSHPFHAHRFAQYGIPFHPCGPFVSQGELNELLDRMMAHRNPLNQLKTLLRDAILADGKQYFESAKQALKGRDLVVSHMIDFLGQAAAAQLGIPRVGVVLTHSVIPTAVSSPALVPNIRLLNPVSWKLMTWMVRPIDKEVESFLHGLGVTHLEIKRFACLGDDLNLLAASETLAGVPSDALPVNVKCTGPWSIPAPAEKPDPALSKFLEKYPKPVFVSLGSMGGSHGKALTEKLIEALKITGMPAVIQSGYAGLGGGAGLPENIHVTGFVSHEFLFPKAACVVHHAGAGTTAAVCRAGVPSVGIIFIADQPYFAKQLKRLGIASEYFWYYKLKTKRLASAIRRACDPEMQQRARTLQPVFMAERGVERAVEILENHWSSIKKIPNR